MVKFGSARSLIPKKLKELFSDIGDSNKGSWNGSIHSRNIETKLKFWDEVDYFPYICIIPGPERRQYLPSDFKWGILAINIHIYVKNEYEDPQEGLESLIRDVESVVENNNVMEYATGYFTTDVRVSNIVTDSGVLAPYGVGEVQLQVRYEIV